MKQKLTYRHDGEKGTAMTYLEILGWARKGLQAEKANYRQMQEKALEGQATLWSRPQNTQGTVICTKSG